MRMLYKGGSLLEFLYLRLRTINDLEDEDELLGILDDCFIALNHET